MVYSQHDRVFSDFPTSLSTEEKWFKLEKHCCSSPLHTHSLYQCSARVAQDIEGHHRPVIASIFHSLNMDSPSKKLVYQQPSFLTGRPLIIFVISQKKQPQPLLIEAISLLN